MSQLDSRLYSRINELVEEVRKLKSESEYLRGLYQTVRDASLDHRAEKYSLESRIEVLRDETKRQSDEILELGDIIAGLEGNLGAAEDALEKYEGAELVAVVDTDGEPI